MKRWLALLILLTPISLFGQSTTLSGTVQDTDGQLWFAGSAVASFVPAPGTTLGQYTWTGGVFNPGLSITTQMNTSGVYSLSIPSNTAIVPSGSRWTVTVNSGTTSLTTASVTITVTGATQTQNFTPTAIRISAGPGAVAYTDTEVTAQVGQSYFQLNTTPASSVSRVCQVVTGTTCTTWANAGGSGSPSSPGFAPGILASNYSSWSAKTVYGCAWTNGQATITGCLSGTFAASDVGKKAWATNASSNVPDQVNPATIVVCPETTILSFQSSTAVTLNANCTASALTTDGRLFVFGPDETSGVIAFFTAVANACGTGIWPMGKAIITAPAQTNPPPASCQNADGQQRTGPTFIGQGVGNSQLLPAPSFDFTKCTNGGSGNSCFFGTSGTGNVSGENCMNLSIYGSGNGNPTVAAPHNIMEIDSGAYFYNCSILSWGGNSANLTGLQANGTPISIVGVQVDGAGFVNCKLPGTSSGTTIAQSFCGDSFGTALQVQGTGIVQSSQNIFGLTYGNNVNATLIDVGVLFVSDEDVFSGGTNAGNTNTTIAVTGANTVAQFNNGRVDCGVAQFTCLFVGTSTASAHLRGMKVGSTGHTLNYVAGANIFDDCGNTFAAGSGNTTNGNLFGSCSITGTVQTAGNFAPGAGLGTSTFGTITGNSLHGQVTITYAGALATPATFTMTFPTTFIVAPSCTVTDVGGTNPFPTQIVTTSTATVLTTTMTFAAAPVAANTDIFIWNCSN